METSKLINLSAIKKENFSPSIEKDNKQMPPHKDSLLSIIFALSMLVYLIAFIIVKSWEPIMELIFGVKQNLNYFIQNQNYFCDYIHMIYDLKIEDELLLYEISLNNTKFEMFIYKNYDYVSKKIYLNHSFKSNITLNMLKALKYYAKQNNIKNNQEIVVIDIGGNIGWYSTFLGSFRYTVLTFEPDPTNYYVIRKNFCRNNRDFFGNLSSIIIVNKTLYTEEKACDYYKNNNTGKYLILCNTSKSNNLQKNYKKISSVQSTKLSKLIPDLNSTKIALIRIDLDAEGEKAIESGAELITKFHVPYIFMEFSLRPFKERETDPKQFLQFFKDNGYNFSLNGFLNTKTISIEKILENKIETINLYLSLNKERKINKNGI